MTLSSSDQVVYATASEIVAQTVRYSREKKKDKGIENYLMQALPAVLSKLKDVSKGVLNSFGSLLILQELVNADSSVFFTRIIEEIETDKGYLKAIGEFISGSQINKLE
jgi:hypothetical protein